MAKGLNPRSRLCWIQLWPAAVLGQKSMARPLCLEPAEHGLARKGPPRQQDDFFFEVNDNLAGFFWKMIIMFVLHLHDCRNHGYRVERKTTQAR